jgi:hydrogenase expression/formation protein HypE
MLREHGGLSIHNLKPGDKLLVSGFVGEHGASILGARKELNFTSDLKSDCASLTSLVECILETEADVHSMRDATRGGVAAVVNEMGTASDITLVIEEEAVPVSEEVKAVCSLLGMSPLDMANEGKLIAAAAPDDAEKVLNAMKKHPLGKHAAVIGTVEEKGKFPAVLVTSLGVRNILEMPRGELLPRIC